MGNNICENEREKKDGEDETGEEDKGDGRSEGKAERRVMGRENPCDLFPV